MYIMPKYKQGDIVEYIDSDGDKSLHYISLWREDKQKYAIVKSTCEIGNGSDWKAGRLVFENKLILIKSK